jgi:GT2 family glycosyltransferase/truncated hemoglobin YjbI
MEAVEKKQIVYVVLGMHRSGTSAMGGVLEALGVEFSNNLIPGDPEINLKGYWEHGEINVLHDQLLGHLGSSWDDPKPLPNNWLDGDLTAEFRDKLINVINKDFGKSRIWGFKDPRLCALLPLWMDIFEELRIEPYFIIMVRHPEEVADSLFRRNGFDWQKSSLLWTKHFLEAEYHTRNRRRVFISFDDLLADWRCVVAGIAKEFQTQWPRDPEMSASAINKLLDDSLKHHNYNQGSGRLALEPGSICSQTFSIARNCVINACPTDQSKAADRLRRELDMSLLPHEINSAKKEEKEDSAKIRAIAFYLPQFHSIPENDEWWGSGFTDWTNVVKAKPLFPGHYQPQLPANGNFYDLRDSEAREWQARLAREHGIYGFCYYHYWFNGKRLLETPFTEVLKSGKPDFPFCLCWANENWTRRWDGNDQDILIIQEYSHEDDLNFIRDLIPAFSDKRYIRINGKPLLIIYRAELFPDIRKTVAIWRSEMIEAGIGDIYLANVENFVSGVDPSTIGFDAAIEFTPSGKSAGITVNKMLAAGFYEGFREVLPITTPPYIYDYEIAMKNVLQKKDPPYKRFRCLFPGWDNTARRAENATVFINSSPGNFETFLNGMKEKVNKEFQGDERIIFINSWNEWGEGCHLEPDEKYGKTYLEICKKILSDDPESAAANRHTVSIIVVNYNGRSYLEECFNSLLKMENAGFSLQLIMVDNLSQDNSVQFVKQTMPQVKIIENDVNNFARALNLGIRNSTGDYIAFLNNDTRVDRHWLTGLLDVLMRDERIGAVQSKILFSDGETINSVGVEEEQDYYFKDAGFNERDRGQYDTAKELDYFTGGSVLLRRACMDSVGLVDEDFIMFFEDVDYGIRCKKAGWKIYFSPQSIVYHKYHGMASMELATYLSSRNRLLWIAKHFPLKLPESVRTSKFFPDGRYDDLYDSLIQAARKLLAENPVETSLAVFAEIKDVLLGIYGTEKTKSFFSQVELLTGLKQIKMGIHDHRLTVIDASKLKAGELVPNEAYLSPIAAQLYLAATLDRPVLAVFNRLEEVIRRMKEYDNSRRSYLEQIYELDRMLAEKDRQVQKLTKWATGAETYAKSLLEASAAERIEKDKQVQSLTEWATGAEAYAKSVAEQVQSLTEWATGAETYAKSLAEEVGRMHRERAEQELQITKLNAQLSRIQAQWLFRLAKLIKRTEE